MKAMEKLRDRIQSVFPNDSLGFPYSLSYLSFETNKVKLLKVYIDHCYEAKITSCQAVALEGLSTECRKSKTKVINLTNHRGLGQFNQPIKTQSKHM